MNDLLEIIGCACLVTGVVILGKPFIPGLAFVWAFTKAYVRGAVIVLGALL